MGIEDYIRQRKTGKEILLMTHQILGYPSFEVNQRAIEIFVKNDVDLIELQIPFSEPVADGPIFLHANQVAVQNGVTVASCLEFVQKMTKQHSTAFFIMTYYNIIFSYGLEKFIKTCKEIGVVGLIVPDAPIDDAYEFYDLCKTYELDAVGIATPYTKEARLQSIASVCKGFLYFVPRKGVTGSKTTFDHEILESIRLAKQITKKSIAVGFGIQEKEDLDQLRGISDIAIVGSKILKVIESDGIEGVEAFIQSMYTITK